jgi:hypothetical protein
MPVLNAACIQVTMDFLLVPPCCASIQAVYYTTFINSLNKVGYVYFLNELHSLPFYLAFLKINYAELTQLLILLWQYFEYIFPYTRAKVTPKCLFFVRGFLKTKFIEIKNLETTCIQEAI